MAKVFCPSTGYMVHTSYIYVIISYNIYIYCSIHAPHDHYLTYLSRYLQTRTWNLIFFFVCCSFSPKTPGADERHAAQQIRRRTRSIKIQYNIMCLVTVHRGGGRVGRWGRGHCGNGEYRFIASPSSVFLVGNLHEDDGVAANRPRWDRRFFRCCASGAAASVAV